MNLKKFQNIDVLIDNPSSWMWEYLQDLEASIEPFAKLIRVFRSASEVSDGDIMIILSCDKILKQNDLAKHKSNIVIHESDLPKGKGWSPLSWQAESGVNKIPITLFEASEKLDSGDWYIKDTLLLDGRELIDEIRVKQYAKTKEMIIKYLQNYPVNSNKQEGEESFFQKRVSKNQELDIDKSLKEQFNKLRVCDNERYPAHFYIDEKKYVLKIEEV